jgi:hypothetical protein
MAIAKKAGVTKLLMMTDPSAGTVDKPEKPGEKPAEPPVR